MKVFDKPSPYFIREIGSVILGFAYINGMDYVANEYILWKNISPIIKKYTNFSENYYFDPKSMD